MSPRRVQGSEGFVRVRPLRNDLIGHGENAPQNPVGFCRSEKVPRSAGDPGIVKLTFEDPDEAETVPVEDVPKVRVDFAGGQCLEVAIVEGRFQTEKGGQGD